VGFQESSVLIHPHGIRLSAQIFIDEKATFRGSLIPEAICLLASFSTSGELAAMPTEEAKRQAAMIVIQFLISFPFEPE